MKMILGVLLGLVAFAASGEQRQQEFWAAYAYSPSDTAFFSSVNQPTQREARDDARRWCGKANCVVGIVVKNGCMALTTSYDAYTGRYLRAFARADKKADAEKKSFDLCKSKTPRLCILMDSQCTFGAPTEPEVQINPLEPLAEDHVWAKGVLKLLNVATAYFLQKNGDLSPAGALTIKEMGDQGPFLFIAPVQEAISDRDMRKLIALAKRMGYISED